jgi:hypothetical protein
VAPLWLPWRHYWCPLLLVMVPIARVVDEETHGHDPLKCLSYSNVVTEQRVGMMRCVNWIQIAPGQHVCHTNELLYSRIDWTVRVPCPRRCRLAFVRVVLDQSFPCCAVLRLILSVIHPRNPDLHPRLMMGRHLPTPLALLVLDRFTILIQSLLFA